MRLAIPSKLAAATPAALVTLALFVGGCPHRPPPAAEPSADGWYRKENLFFSFDADARGVSLVNAYLLELACFVGDKGTFELDRTLEAWGFDRRREFRDLRTSTYGYVASNDRMVLVTFGGTDVLNLRDVLGDADALTLVYDERYCASPEARVHRGFRDGLNSVIDGVIEEVRRQAAATAPAPSTGPTTEPTTGTTGGASAPATAAARPKAVWVAGHSRGGAFAVLAAAALARAEGVPPVAGVYTFGQPRVGNGAFAEGLDGAGVPLFRLVNRDDPVPGIPPEVPASAGRLGLASTYRHGGTAVVLRADGRVARGSATEARRSLSLRDLPDPRAAGASVANHYQPAYQAAIFAALRDPQLVSEPDWRAAVPSGAAGMLPAPRE